MSASTRKLRYHGTGGSLLLLVLRNLLFTMLTLGIYSFWARTRLREYHYNHTELGDERFVWHGTGGELLKGALMAAGVFMLLGIGLAVFMPKIAADPILSAVAMVAFYGVILLLVAVAINGSRRYRLSRSSWRGIHFAFAGETKDYIALMVKCTLLTIVTLGLYAPFFQNHNRAFMVNNARFGSEPFEYDGEGRALFWPYLKALLLAPFTLGLSLLWYHAHRHRYFWAHTRIAGAKFSSSVEGGSLLALSLTNMLLVIFTLGIGLPWALVRMHRYWADNLRMHGAPEWATIQQRIQQPGAAAEGLAEGLDVDVGIGI